VPTLKQKAFRNARVSPSQADKFYNTLLKSMVMEMTQRKHRVVAEGES